MVTKLYDYSFILFWQTEDSYPKLSTNICAQTRILFSYLLTSLLAIRITHQIIPSWKHEQKKKNRNHLLLTNMPVSQQLQLSTHSPHDRFSDRYYSISKAHQGRSGYLYFARDAQQACLGLAAVFHGKHSLGTFFLQVFHQILVLPINCFI